MPGPYTTPNQFDSAVVNVFAWANRHVQVRYLGPSGVSLSPLQRAGAVSAASHNFAQNQRRGAMGPPGMGDGPPAGLVGVTFPPVVQIHGTPRDSSVQV